MSKTQEVVYFDKYDQRGAYHWEECNPRSSKFNPPLVARYEVVRRELARRQPARRVLDVGCGDAYLMTLVEPFCEELWGVDTELKAVELANQILADHPRCRATQADCYHLPFEDAYFNAVLLTDVIEHLTDPDGCTREIARVLKANGYLILTTPKFRPDRKWDIRHEHEYTPDELRDLLERYFSHVEISYFWPLKASNRYRTRIGWRMYKTFGRWGYNPFLNESETQPERYGQMKAVCHGKR